MPWSCAVSHFHFAVPICTTPCPVPKTFRTPQSTTNMSHSGGDTITNVIGIAGNGAWEGAVEELKAKIEGLGSVVCLCMLGHTEAYVLNQLMCQVVKQQKGLVQLLTACVHFLRHTCSVPAETIPYISLCNRIQQEHNPETCQAVCTTCTHMLSIRAQCPSCVKCSTPKLTRLND